MGISAASVDVHAQPVTWQEASEDLLASASRAETLLAVTLGMAPAENPGANTPAQLLVGLAQASMRAEQCHRLLAER
jgi:hypothetical protein